MRRKTKTKPFTASVTTRPVHDTTLFVRIPRAVMDSLDRLVCEQRDALPGHSVTRADVVRALLVSGVGAHFLARRERSTPLSDGKTRAAGRKVAR
jgi:hypothetical protein